MDAISEIFSTSVFMPHGHCYLWRPGLVALHVSSDALIGTAYVVISLTLWQLVRHIRLPFSPMILAFGVFIGACGLTHYMEIWTLWEPQYWISGGVKAITAAASVATGLYLVQLRPVVVEVTRSARLSEERKEQLEAKNRELEVLYRRVKELDEVKTRFFANASHELRTPLALVVGPIEKLLARGAPDDARAGLEVARRNARLLLRHVDELLDVARLEEGRMALHPEPTDLAVLAREVAAHFEGVARERGVTLTVDAPPALAARVDAPKVERVLANLVGNAFKFAPDGGRVRMALARAGDRATLAVEDDGPGIAPELREAVFERFRQDPGRPSRFGGAGLGLAIARDLVVLHGGSIRVRDAEIGGARLEIDLPLGDGGAAGTPPPAARRPSGAVAADVAEEVRAQAAVGAAPGRLGPAGAPLVLVVEDNREALGYVASAMAEEFAVETASDGREGLRKAEALRPDAVVTDLMMPEHSGDALVRDLRREPALADTPVVVLTARTDEPTRVALLAAGAHDYVTKPFHPDELRARVRNAVAMKRARDALGRELAVRGGEVEALAEELGRRRRELEVSLETARVAQEQAERASAVKSTFLSLVSHELRTPLTALQLGVAALHTGRAGALSEAQARTVERLARACARLLALVDTLLEYTRVESGRLVVRNEPVDVAAVAREVADDLLPQAQQKLLALDVEAPAGLSPATTDPRLLRVVLVNLVANAVKYTERGGVRVAVGGGPAGAWVEVRDTGPGIAREEQARVFHAFEQIGTPGTSGGVGLGLSLVKGIVDALGARLTLESAPGAGSTFRVELPA